MAVLSCLGAGIVAGVGVGALLDRDVAGPDPALALARVTTTVPVQGPAADPAEESAGHAPYRLAVPALGVGADVLAVATVAGALTPPADPGQLGWWRDGVGVGAEHGSALVTGHTVHGGGGVFDRLGELQVGDLVEATTATGETLSYRVTAVDHVSTQELAEQSTALFAQAGSHRLVLVTCADWNGSSYDGNTVVIARPWLSPSWLSPS